MSTKSGFSLIELIVVVAIIGILASIAYPSYVEHVAKAKRADAIAVLLEGAQALERHYSVNGSYLDTNNNLAAVYPTAVNAGSVTLYTIAATASTANSFTLRATRSGSMAGDKCGNFELSSAGGKSLNGAASGVTIADCWRH
ncbi:type IV pilus assembly protein PilE [Litorivivens lipolytica]|uniref:Type IV pilus assembly protein PilE n=1 Tax=Litorivivens lipolytica TaxID=1524264 RepID=A0A7W4W4X9_9GAMM|nr:type IV pilin protein [Litorivivens lipolytica]MBB3047513.1 type IV pilus assembly protein PilE [Litorivivens lipolytica]